MSDECSVCRQIEFGDTLYFTSYMNEYDDGAITYHPIWDARYCPVCGKKLKKFAWDKDKHQWGWMDMNDDE